MKLKCQFLILLTLLTACYSHAEPQRLSALPQDQLIQVYFNHNQSKNAEYTDSYRKIKRPGDNLEQVIIETINQATSSIDIAVQELRLPKIAHALVKKHEAGIKIRVIIENSYRRPMSSLTDEDIEEFSEREANRYEDFLALVDTNNDGKLSDEEIKKGDALIILTNAGIPLIDDTVDGLKSRGLMHHKFMIVDRQIVIISSANWTMSDIHGDMLNPDSRGNANHLLKITDQKTAKVFEEEFNFMWGDGIGGMADSLFSTRKPARDPQKLQVGDSQVTIKFSPILKSQPWQNSTNGLIAQTLADANSSIDLALFVFFDQSLANTLLKASQQGVEIRALLDQEFAFRNYSEGLDMLGVARTRKCSYEKHNQPWQKPINTVGVPVLPKGDKLHHKFAIINQDIVLTGSHNWSDAANHKNDETLIIIQNPLIAKHFQREFDDLYKTASLGIPNYIQDKIREEQKLCQNPE